MRNKSQKKSGSRATSARNALLAKIHIAKKELALDDDLYREILMDEFGVETAADLSEAELERLIDRFVARGWRPRARNAKLETGNSKKNGQAEALKERIGQEVLHSELTPERLRGLVRKICGVEDLRWVGDAVRLRRLLAVIADIIRREDGNQ